MPVSKQRKPKNAKKSNGRKTINNTPSIVMPPGFHFSNEIEMTFVVKDQAWFEKSFYPLSFTKKLELRSKLLALDNHTKELMLMAEDGQRIGFWGYCFRFHPAEVGDYFERSNLPTSATIDLAAGHHLSPAEAFIAQYAIQRKLKIERADRIQTYFDEAKKMFLLGFPVDAEKVLSLGSGEEYRAAAMDAKSKIEEHVLNASMAEATTTEREGDYPGVRL